MLLNNIVVLLFGIVIAFLHFYSTPIIEKLFKHKMRIISFGAGISITYIFLVLLPELYQGVQSLEKLIFIYILIGFTMFHLLEKYIYQHTQRRKMLQELKEAHSIAFFVYHFVLGIVLAKITDDLAAGIYCPLSQ